MYEDCRSCWYQEGGHCYFGDVPRLPNGCSTKPADGPCRHYRSKRDALGSVIPNEKLVILSEHRKEPP
jgi:hypothetical protein